MSLTIDKNLYPCVGICSTTSQGDMICRGCNRKAADIIAWNSYTDEKKRRITQGLKQPLTSFGFPS